MDDFYWMLELSFDFLENIFCVKSERKKNRKQKVKFKKNINTSNLI